MFKFKYKIYGSVWVVFCVLLMGLPVAAQDGGDVTVLDAYGNEVTIRDTSRIVTIDGSVTEMVFALGAGEQVVARDDSSLYPLRTNDLESVGYVRQISAEPVLALDPTLIITTESIGPVEAVEQLTASGVTILVLPSATSIEGVIGNIETLARVLDRENEAERLVSRIEADYAAAQELLETVETRPRVMFIYARGAGAVSVAGTNTAAETMIGLAGGENAVTEYEGYQPITAEAVVAVNPDVIVMMTRGLDSIGGVDGLLEQPGIALTSAGENQRFLVIDDLYLVGFSTRIGTAVLDLTYLMHEELSPPMITYLRADGNYETLLTVLEAAGQIELLSGDGEYTLFAPTNEAFDALPEGMLDGLMSSTISLQAVMSYHILDGVYMEDDLAALEGQTAQTLYPDGQLAFSLDDGEVVVNGVAHITDTHWVTANGIVHVVDAVLVPERP